MRILSRCSDILVANIHALLDKAENPEAMIAQIIREMEDDLAVARGHAASAIAAERGLNRELTDQRIEIEFWQTKARAAVAANREDMARVALRSQRSLIARHRAVQARRALCRVAGKRIGSDFTSGAKLQRYAQRLTDLEDLIAAETEVQGLEGPETTFATWETEAELDRELAALKEENARKS